MGIASNKPHLPRARGPASEALAAALRAEPGPLPDLPAVPDVLCDDAQLALYICYELHYRGFRDVDDGWEWNPDLLARRAVLERAFLDRLRAELGAVPDSTAQVSRLLAPSDGEGSTSGFLRDEGQRWQIQEYLAARSLYHLKEADPQSWAIPRTHGDAQSVLVALQYDEYGGGRPERVHAKLFADMMRAWGLDAAYGAQVDAAPWQAMAVVNLMSLFGLHRAHRGALLGQFARVEIASSPSSARLVEAFKRHDVAEAGYRFYDEHVEADAVHEQLVRRGVLDGLLRDEPHLEADVAFGLAASGFTETALGNLLLESWKAERSALRANPSLVAS
ncbi:iron-containing redox enzyme family protein [Catenulispora subtropica]|uniref:Iron-containing redox enzyme family protein n=1 Tax=Catenulispora subtropica TaxID=450798 RepID=A0ABP5DWP4_9ACTN